MDLLGHSQIGLTMNTCSGYQISASPFRIRGANSPSVAKSQGLPPALLYATGFKSIGMSSIRPESRSDTGTGRSDRAPIASPTRPPRSAACRAR